MYHINILGVRETIFSLQRGQKAARSMRPALLKIRQDMWRVIRATFTSQGRRYGGSWTFLKEETIKAKARRAEDPRILIAKQALMNSWTKRENRHMRTSVSAHDIKLASTIEYSDTHQYGDPERGIPARPFIDFHERDKARWVGMCAEHLKGAMGV